MSNASCPPRLTQWRQIMIKAEKKKELTNEWRKTKQISMYNGRNNSFDSLFKITSSSMIVQVLSSVDLFAYRKKLVWSQSRLINAQLLTRRVWSLISSYQVFVHDNFIKIENELSWWFQLIESLPSHFQALKHAASQLEHYFDGYDKVYISKFWFEDPKCTRN